jgi:hypothetical protein
MCVELEFGSQLVGLCWWDQDTHLSCDWWDDIIIILIITTIIVVIYVISVIGISRDGY